MPEPALRVEGARTLRATLKRAGIGVQDLKAAHKLPPADPAREARQIKRLRDLAESAKLDPAFAEKLLNFIIAEVIRHHETIARS